jgi:hypothetical protein
MPSQGGAELGQVHQFSDAAGGASRGTDPGNRGDLAPQGRRHPDHFTAHRPLLSQALFSAVVVMVLVTTLIAPIELAWAFARAKTRTTTGHG